MKKSKKVKFEELMEELKELDLKVEKIEKQDLIWLSLPFTEENVEKVKRALKKIGLNKDEYTLSYDFDTINLIF